MNNITETSVQDSMHPKADVLTLHRESIEEIINLDTEPILGFPLTTDQFCKDKHLLHLGKKYFAYPPQSLVKASRISFTFKLSKPLHVNINQICF
jgi:hypothetical protein